MNNCQQGETFKCNALERGSVSGISTHIKVKPKNEGGTDRMPKGVICFCGYWHEFRGNTSSKECWLIWKVSSDSAGKNFSKIHCKQEKKVLIFWVNTLVMKLVIKSCQVCMSERKKNNQFWSTSGRAFRKQQSCQETLWYLHVHLWQMHLQKTAVFW